MVLARVANVKSGWKSMFMVRPPNHLHSSVWTGPAWLSATDCFYGFTVIRAVTRGLC